MAARLMRGFVKTLFGNRRTVLAACLCVALALLFLNTPLARFSGIVFAAALLSGAAYLAKY